MQALSVSQLKQYKPDQEDIFAEIEDKEHADTPPEHLQ